MNILGISCYYHDSSVCLLQSGKVTAAAAEERFTRVKHDTSFPENAVSFCLKKGGISINDVDYIAFYEKPILKFERVLSQSIEGFPKTAKIFLKSMPSWFTEKLRIPQITKKTLQYKGDILFIDHHLSHAAAFLLSPYKEGAVVTIDGVGEWTTTAYGVGREDSVKITKEINFPHSLGLFYSAVTAYLGFKVNNSEYKVMGLAAYGEQDKSKNIYYEKLKEVIKINSDGSFSLDMSFFDYRYKEKMPSSKMCHLLGGPVRKKEEIDKRHKDIAAALQLTYEDVFLNLLNVVQKETGKENLVLGGGCGLNSVANGKILSRTNFKNVWIPPDPGDGGNSMGAACYAFSSILKKGRVNSFSTPYLGPSFKNNEIADFLEDNNVNYSKFKSKEDKIKTVAKLISQGKVVAWFQGGMEWGPRALGARSILSDPTNKKMKEILNKKVKHREEFRPFAPVVCGDDVNTFFHCDENLSSSVYYMLMVYPIKKEYRDKIPSVVHADGSGRLQVIEREMNEEYHDLIKEFGQIAKIPILINTSFNIRGEPVVCTPYDAYKCMMGTGIDVLCMEDFLIYREENKQDMWDSEKKAKD